jgi:hypothetical protein
LGQFADRLGTPAVEQLKQETPARFPEVWKRKSLFD